MKENIEESAIKATHQHIENIKSNLKQTLEQQEKVLLDTLTSKYQLPDTTTANTNELNSNRKKGYGK